MGAATCLLMLSFIACLLLLNENGYVESKDLYEESSTGEPVQEQSLKRTKRTPLEDELSQAGFVVIFTHSTNFINGKLIIKTEVVRVEGDQSAVKLAHKIRYERRSQPNTKLIDVKPFVYVDGHIHQQDLYEKVKVLEKEKCVTTKVLHETLDNETKSIQSHRDKVAELEEQIQAKLQELALLNSEKQAVVDNFELEKREHSNTQEKYSQAQSELERLHAMHNTIEKKLTATERRLEETDASKERRGDVIEKKQKENLRLIEELGELNAKYSETTRENEELSRDVNHFSVKLQLAHQMIKEDIEFEKGLRKIADDLKHKIKIKDNQNGFHQQTIKTLENLLDAEVTNHKMTEAKFTEMHKGLQDKLADLTTRNALLETNIAEHEKALILETADKSKIGAMLHEVKVEKARLEEEIMSLRKTTTDFQIENADLKAAKEAMMKDNHVLDKQIVVLGEKEEAFKAEIEQLKRDIQEGKGDKQELEYKLAERENERGRLVNEMSELKEQKAALQEQVSNLMHNNTKLKKDIDGLKSQINNINSTKAELEKEIKKLELKNQKRDGDEHVLKTLIKNLRNTKLELRKTNESLIVKTKELEQNVQKANGRLADKRVKAKKYKSLYNAEMEAKEQIVKEAQALKAQVQQTIDKNSELERLASQLNLDLKVANHSLATETTLKHELHKQLSRIAADMEHLKKENGAHMESIHTLKEISAGLTAQVDQHKVTEQQFESVKQELNRQLQKLDNMKASLKEDIQRLTSEKTTSIAEKERVEKELHAAYLKQTELAADLKNAQMASTNFNLSNEHLKSVNAAMLKDSQELKLRIATMETESRHLREKKEALNTDLSHQKALNENNKQSYLLAEAEYRNTIANMTTQKLALDTQLAEKDNNNVKLEENKAALQNQVDSMKTLKMEFERQIESLSERIKDETTDKYSLHKQVEQLEWANKTLKETKNQLERTIVLLQEKNSALDEQNSELKHTNEHLKTNIAAIDQEKRNLLSDLKELQTLYRASDANKHALDIKLVEATAKMVSIAENHDKSEAYNTVLRKEIDELQTVIESMRGVDEEQRASIQYLTQKRAKHKLNKQEIKLKQQQLNEQLEKLKIENERNTKEAIILHHQSTKENGQNRELLGKLAAVEAHKVELAEQLRKADSEKTAFLIETTTLKSDKAQLVSHQRELEAAIKYNNMVIAEKEESVKQLRQENAKQRAEKLDLSEQISQHLAEIVELKGINADNQLQKAELDVQVSILTGEKQALIKNQSALKAQVEQQKEINQSIQKQIQALDTQIKEHKEYNSKLEQEQESLKEAKNNLEDIAQTLTETNLYLKEQSKKDAAEMTHIKQKNQEIVKLEQKRDELQSLLANSQTQIKILEALKETNEKEKEQMIKNKNSEEFILSEVADFLSRNISDLRDGAAVEERKQQALRILQKVTEMVDRIAKGGNPNKGYFARLFTRIGAAVRRIANLTYLSIPQEAYRETAESGVELKEIFTSI